ncbi:serine hydrolase domain-containing protein [Aspergillus clavatus NRRL 1]|uniref:Beta-lactamase n=1 Tax=Aspergillus clavatus (strain ATCC 1007 / CBS 513.65 / DSM 816 / NCTC 3887 / NRRL 1 / QM 1276 / 107) TaxID=344612 RepID=A1CAU7_ASPCL|nr:beta-lactamase [Aspergillus clavatus NRRL 1]EAW12865.1 beta-lactamase [Aspergillus clavatus NRRL 1]
MAQVQGQCHPAFSSLKAIFEQYLASGEELGADISVNIAGETVVELWGGYTDVSKSKPWTQDTLTPVWSVSKIITNLAALLLIDRGQLDPYAKVAQYWPEFAEGGKRDIEVRHLLSHTAGLPAWDPPLLREDFLNVPLATEKLIQQQPWWTPGTTSGYHLVSQGNLVGEVVRRVSGKSLAQFIRDELSSPLDADYHLGLPEVDWPRTADVVPPPPIPGLDQLPPDSIPVRAFRGTLPNATECMTPEFRRAELGASGGFGNARAINRIVSMVSMGGTVNGRRFLSPESIDLIFKEQVSGVDLVLGSFLRFGMGMALPAPENPGLDFIPQGRVCYWGGWGGSIAIMDVDRKVTITYTMNKMGNGTLGNGRTGEYVKAVYAALDAYQPSS